MSFVDRLRVWFGGTSSSSHAARMEACLEDPDAAFALLQDEQRRLSQELEETFLAYDAKARALARRVAAMGDGAVTDHEVATLRAEQTELWRLVRRAQAAARTTRMLERELDEWRGREPGSVPHGHPDHPIIRAEIVGSELRIRETTAAH
jgi:hypothetical protein